MTNSSLGLEQDTLTAVYLFREGSSAPVAAYHVINAEALHIPSLHRMFDINAAVVIHGSGEVSLLRLNPE
mgnify:CR=1 FL=1